MEFPETLMTPIIEPPYIKEISLNNVVLQTGEEKQ